MRIHLFQKKDRSWTKSEYDEMLTYTRLSTIITFLLLLINILSRTQ